MNDYYNKKNILPQFANRYGKIRGKMKMRIWRKREMNSAKSLDSHCGASIGFNGYWVWRHYGCVSIALWLSVCSAGCKVFLRVVLFAEELFVRNNVGKVLIPTWDFTPVNFIPGNIVLFDRKKVSDLCHIRRGLSCVCMQYDGDVGFAVEENHSFFEHFFCTSPHRKTRNHGFEFRHFEFTHGRRDEAAGVPLASGRAECRLPDGELRVQAKTRW